MPRVYLIDNPQPNAFATGRNPRVPPSPRPPACCSMLTGRIAGVMAHELAHIKNRDTLIMTVSATIAGAIASLAHFGFLFGGRGDDRPNVVVILLTALVAPLAAMVIQMAISRSREYDADRMGADHLGKPIALASALAKIEAASPTSPTRTPSGIPRPRRSSSSTLFPADGMDNLFSTHPATENRIAALQALAQEMGHGC